MRSLGGNSSEPRRCSWATAIRTCRCLQTACLLSSSPIRLVGFVRFRHPTPPNPPNPTQPNPTHPNPTPPPPNPTQPHPTHPVTPAPHPAPQAYVLDYVSFQMGRTNSPNAFGNTMGCIQRSLTFLAKCSAYALEKKERVRRVFMLGSLANVVKYRECAGCLCAGCSPFEAQ